MKKREYEEKKEKIPDGNKQSAATSLEQSAAHSSRVRTLATFFTWEALSSTCHRVSTICWSGQRVIFDKK